MFSADKKLYAGTMLLITTLIAACSKPQEQVIAEPERSKTLFDFEQSQITGDITALNADLSLVKTDNGQALKVEFNAKDNFKSAVAFSNNAAWDWSQEDSVSLSMDIENPSDESAHVFFALKHESGDSHNSTALVPANSKHRYWVTITGNDMMIETGLRSNPKPNDGYRHFVWRWGNKWIDLSKVSELEFSFTSMARDTTLIIDDLSVHPSKPFDESLLINISDQYGQNMKAEFADKIHNDEELKQRTKQELTELDGKLMSDRSRFGGYKDGPKLAATGYFRTQKHNGKWWLVDPEGHLFYSHGIANIRMANTSTFTGYDFKDDSVRQTNSNEVTPEDSKGLSRVKGEALASRYVASELRKQMFNWLPNYDDELGNHYGYRQSAHIGVLEHGETYSHYQANLERKYGETSPYSFIDKWKDVTLDRMRNWGFTSFGNWVDPMFYQQDKMPYFANGWIIGDFKTVSSGNDYWSPLPDPFDPEFANRARITIDIIAEEVKNSPWCVGVFIDNEKSWGNKSSPKAHYAIVINTLTLDASQSPTKSKFVELMQAKYSDIETLNKQWETQISAWSEFAKGVTIEHLNDALLEDYSLMLYEYASKYFEVVHGELARAMPNHLYMGVRMANWGMTPEIVNASAKYVDVVSYNYYKESLQKDEWAFLKEVDMPSIIGEFHFGAFDTGYFNPGLGFAETQAERARMYKDYMESVLALDHMVGAHWFQYIDSPITGRAHDGENYNVGFVSIADVPHTEMIKAAKQVNAKIYTKRLSESN